MGALKRFFQEGVSIIKVALTNSAVRPGLCLHGRENVYFDTLVSTLVACLGFFVKAVS